MSAKSQSSRGECQLSRSILSIRRLGAQLHLGIADKAKEPARLRRPSRCKLDLLRSNVGWTMGCIIDQNSPSHGTTTIIFSIEYQNSGQLPILGQTTHVNQSLDNPSQTKHLPKSTGSREKKVLFLTKGLFLINQVFHKFTVPIRCWRHRTFRSWNGPPLGNNPTSSAKCTWRKQSQRGFGELLRLVMDHPKRKSREVLWKQTYLGPWTKSRKVSSLKITDQDHTKSTSQFRINSLLKAGTVDQVLNLRAQSISLLPTLNLDPYLHHGIVWK